MVVSRSQHLKLSLERSCKLGYRAIQVLVALFWLGEEQRPDLMNGSWRA
jgi:hypothetical protein